MALFTVEIDLSSVADACEGAECTLLATDIYLRIVQQSNCLHLY